MIILYGSVSLQFQSCREHWAHGNNNIKACAQKLKRGEVTPLSM